MLFAAVAIVGCNPLPPVINPNQPGGNDSTNVENPDKPILGDTLTVANLIQMKEDGTLPAKDAGTEAKWVKGYIVGVYDFDASDKFVLTGTTAVGTNLLIADDPECADTYAVASVKLAAGLFRDALSLAAHPENYKKPILLHGIVEAYCGIAGVVDLDAAFLDGEQIKDSSVDPSQIDYQEGEISCSDFVNSDTYKNIASGETTEEEFTVRGIVKEIKQIDTGTYGNAQFYITDGTSEVYCYNLYAGPDKQKFVSSEQLKVGDIVTVKSTLTNYNGTKELKEGYIVRTTNTFDPGSVDTSTKVVTVAEVLAMNIASGAQADGTYQITGSIATITEAFGTQYGNATFTITDDSSTEELIIYRAKYLDNQKWTENDPQIQPGDEVTIQGGIKNYNGTIEFVNCYITKHN